MTNTEIKNRINELDRELWMIEMADRMNDEERRTHDKLLAERNRLATELYYMEHPKEETKEEEWFEPLPTREEERKEREKEEADKRLTLKLWEAMRGTNWIGLPVIEKKIREKNWI